MFGHWGSSFSDARSGAAAPLLIMGTGSSRPVPIGWLAAQKGGAPRHGLLCCCTSPLSQLRLRYIHLIEDPGKRDMLQQDKQKSKLRCVRFDRQQKKRAATAGGYAAKTSQYVQHAQTQAPPRGRVLPKKALWLLLARITQISSPPVDRRRDLADRRDITVADRLAAAAVALAILILLPSALLLASLAAPLAALAAAAAAASSGGGGGGVGCP